MCVCMCVFVSSVLNLEPSDRLSLNLIRTLCHFLTQTIDEVEWSVSRLIRFNPGDKAGGAHWLRGLVGLGAGLDRQIFV